MSTAVLSASGTPPHSLSHKRKRSRSRSPPSDNAPPSSRRRSTSPGLGGVDLPRVSDVDPVRKAERERQLAARAAAAELNKMNSVADPVALEAKKDADARAELAKLTSTRSGGVYVPPARLRAMREAAAADKTSNEYQRLSWDALRKSITGIVNRVNVTNIKDIIPELFEENLIRGRGLFCRSVMKAQAASLPFTPVFAALVSVVNTKLPQVGELLVTRLVSQFRRSFKRNDKIVCGSTTTFIAHLVNHTVAHEIIVLEILMLLLERPTDDSIEIAVGLMREVGAYLTENSPKANTFVFERFRAVLNEGAISARVQYMIEVLMQVRKDKFKDNPVIPEGLDLVEEDDQITHQIQLEGDLQVQEGLNIFKADPKYIENEEKYKAIKTEILGADSDEESGSGSEAEESDEEEGAAPEKQDITDKTGTNLVNLRRVIYLTIMNALNYEEAVHKLLKVQLAEGEEIEMVNMIIECCSQERSYSNFYGLVSERFSKINRVWTDCFEQAFVNYYTTIHRYETNRLRNIARLFGHMFASDAISWAVMTCIRMNEDDTTSSSRIFLKIVLTEVMESMGIASMKERFVDDEVKVACQGMFPMDNPKDTRFAINYFTSIGLGAITEDMREHLKNAPKIIMEQRRQMLEAESSSSSDDTSSDDSSDDSESESDSDSDASDHSHARRQRIATPPPRSSKRSPQSSPSRRRARTPGSSPPPSSPRRDRERGIDRDRDGDHRMYDRGGRRREEDHGRGRFSSRERDRRSAEGTRNVMTNMRDHDRRPRDVSRERSYRRREDDRGPRDNSLERNYRSRIDDRRPRDASRERARRREDSRERKRESSSPLRPANAGMHPDRLRMLGGAPSGGNSRGGDGNRRR